MSLDFLAYVGLFSWQTWLSFLAFVIICSAMLYLIPNLLRESFFTPERSRRLTFLNAVSYIGLLILQTDYQITVLTPGMPL